MVRIIMLTSCALLGWWMTCQTPTGFDKLPHRPGDKLFIYQGDYTSLGSLDDIALIAALHDYAVFTHGFYLDGSLWEHGGCLDVNYSLMPELLVKVRALNPDIKIFVYVPATADHPNGCWPQPSIQLLECPGGECADFKSWIRLWLDLEKSHAGIRIDGIFIDLVHPALISSVVRDSLYHHVKACGKLIMANALSDTVGVRFASSSRFLQPEDFLFIEGYHLISGFPNLQTEGMNRLLHRVDLHWAVLSTESPNTEIDCFAKNRREAYARFKKNGGTAFAYQSSDLGTRTGQWIYCPYAQD